MAAAAAAEEGVVASADTASQPATVAPAGNDAPGSPPPADGGSPGGAPPAGGSGGNGDGDGGGNHDGTGGFIELMLQSSRPGNVDGASAASDAVATDSGAGDANKVAASEEEAAELLKMAQSIAAAVEQVEAAAAAVVDASAAAAEPVASASTVQPDASAAMVDGESAAASAAAAAANAAMDAALDRAFATGSGSARRVSRAAQRRRSAAARAAANAAAAATGSGADADVADAGSSTVSASATSASAAGTVPSDEELRRAWSEMLNADPQLAGAVAGTTDGAASDGNASDGDMDGGLPFEFGAYKPLPRASRRSIRKWTRIMGGQRQAHEAATQQQQQRSEADEEQTSASAPADANHAAVPAEAAPVASADASHPLANAAIAGGVSSSASAGSTGLGKSVSSEELLGFDIGAEIARLAYPSGHGKVVQALGAKAAASKDAAVAAGAAVQPDAYSSVPDDDAMRLLLGAHYDSWASSYYGVKSSRSFVNAAAATNNGNGATSTPASGASENTTPAASAAGGATTASGAASGSSDASLSMEEAVTIIDAVTVEADGPSSLQHPANAVDVGSASAAAAGATADATVISGSDHRTGSRAGSAKLGSNGGAGVTIVEAEVVSAAETDVDGSHTPSSAATAAAATAAADVATVPSATPQIADDAASSAPAPSASTAITMTSRAEINRNVKDAMDFLMQANSPSHDSVTSAFAAAGAVGLSAEAGGQQDVIAAVANSDAMRGETFDLGFGRIVGHGTLKALVSLHPNPRTAIEAEHRRAQEAAEEVQQVEEEVAALVSAAEEDEEAATAAPPAGTDSETGTSTAILKGKQWQARLASVRDMVQAYTRDNRTFVPERFSSGARSSDPHFTSTISFARVTAAAKVGDFAVLNKSGLAPAARPFPQDLKNDSARIAAAARALFKKPAAAGNASGAASEQLPPAPVYEDTGDMVDLRTHKPTSTFSPDGESPAAAASVADKPAGTGDDDSDDGSGGGKTGGGN